MPLRIACPAGHNLIVPDDRAGRTLRCPRCNVAFEVPGGRVQGSAFRVQDPGAGGQLAVKGDLPSVSAPLAIAKVAELPLAQAVVPPPARESAEPPPVKPKSRPRTPQLPVAKAEVPLEMEAVARPEAPRMETPPGPLALPAEPVPPPPIVAEPAAAVVEVAEMATPAIREPEPPQRYREAIAPQAEPVAPQAEPVAPQAIVQPEPQPLPEQPVAAPRAITPDRHWLPAAYGLAAALVAAAAFGIAPAVWDVVDYVRSYDLVDSPHVARWALVVFLLGLVQVGYAAFLFQLPDWTSVWVVTLYSLAQAGLYALMLGLVLISGADGLLVGPSGLELSDKLAGGQAALWCLAMTCLSMILAFFAGRISARWRRAETLIRAAEELRYASP